jgi:acylphosphatase
MFSLDMNERLEAIVSGRVQLVMYRDFAQRKARGLKLVGEVTNLADGTVRVIAEGPGPTLDAYVEKLKHGPLLARVDAVAPVRLPATGAYRRFDITYE